MVVELALLVTASLFAVLLTVHVRLQRHYTSMVKERDMFAARIKVMKDDLPTMTRDIQATTVGPLAKTIDEFRTHITKMTEEAAADRQTVNSLAQSTKEIAETLTSPQKRGRHAELTIERILEVSGFKKGVHYDVQCVLPGDRRADFVIHLPNNRDVILDSKASLEALQSAGKEEKQIKEHVAAVKRHINQLAGREYWKDSKMSTLECVVMVVPEYALVPAMEATTDLVEYAWQRRVVLATPSILMVLLRAVDAIWRQNRLSEDAARIGSIAAELHERLTKFSIHYAKTRDGLEEAIQRYNESVGSWDAKVMPASRRLAEAGAAASDMQEVEPINVTVRSVTKTQFVDDKPASTKKGKNVKVDEGVSTLPTV